ncbi:IclR family transcriptional regulator [Nocardioides jensenii]|uniref:IclR family transcriptional regulator n=1 Tax=Nocardioides jensenii TaxID=1843 RepID=UPI00082F7351|nr:IclR family transcriptional regulator [Nocardioides jensenii]
MTSAPRPPLDTDSVLGKVVAVLSAFEVDDHELRLAEISRRTGLAKGTTHRIVADLVAARLMDRTETGYRLGGKLFELGMRASVERGLLEVATPFMEDLYERTHETVHLGVLEGREVVYVAKIGGHRQASSPSRLGGRMPVHCTAIGKALLAHSPSAFVAEVLSAPLERRTPRTVTGPGLLRRQLDRVVEAGVAFEHEESAVGIVCVAAPVLDADDRPVAAVSVTGPITRFRPEAHASSVHAAAAGVASTLARRAALLRDD